MVSNIYIVYGNERPCLHCIAIKQLLAVVWMWWDCVKNDMESLCLFQKDVQSRNTWRRRIRDATG